MTALCNWDGPRGTEPGADSPWGDPAVASRLLAHAGDPETEVRRQLAGSVPTVTGAAGQQAVHALLFDRVMAVRGCALNSQKGFGLPAWWREIRFPDDGGAWYTCTEPRGFHEWAVRAEAQLRVQGANSTLEVWQRSLRMEHPGNRLVGAIGLGLCGDPKALASLQGLAQETDVRVRAAAAGARVRLGDRIAYQSLLLLVRGDDATGAVCALDMVRGFGTREELDVVEQATRDPRRLVRALAAAGLRELRPVAEHLVDARLAELQKDAEEMVRVAAGGH
jgi:hypothetical protein